MTGERRSLLRPSVIAGAVLASIVASFVLVVLSADGASSLAGRVGGDFPAFYGAGTIVAEGHADRLYDIDRQQRAQSGLHEDEVDVLYFAYPPPVAAGYSLLARLPYVPAYVLHTALMVVAAALAYRIVRPMLPDRRPDGAVVAAAAVTFLPVFMALTLGQNSAVVVLLVVASWRLAQDERDGWAGVVLGLLLFKPQYAVPLIGLHLLRGRWRIAAASAGVGAAWWFAGASMLGRGWIGDWLDQVSDFNAVDAEVNGANAVSWLGMVEHWLGVGSAPAVVVGGLLAAATAALLATMWWRRGSDDLALPMAAAAVGILLISPHAMFYDASLLLVAVAALVVGGRAPGAGLLAAGWALGALHPLKEVIGITPVAVAVVGALVVVARERRRSDDAPQPQELVGQHGT